MALQWQMVTRLGGGASRTACKKSVETCSVKEIGQESGTTYFALLFQTT